MSHRATEQPIGVDLVDVEAGQAPENSHWLLGAHTALYDAGVYQYTPPKYGPQEPGPATRLDYYYYPVLSHDHPYMVELARLEEKYGSLGEVPDDEFPELNDIAVLIKTRKFRTFGDLPDYWENVAQVHGLVVNQGWPLKPDERKLLVESFPGLDTEKLCLLEENRSPSSWTRIGGFIGGGSALVLAAAGICFASFKGA